MKKRGRKWDEETGRRSERHGENNTKQTIQRRKKHKTSSTKKTAHRNARTQIQESKMKINKKPTPPKFVLVGLCNASILALKLASPSVVAKENSNFSFSRCMLGRSPQLVLSIPITSLHSQPADLGRTRSKGGGGLRVRHTSRSRNLVDLLQF